MAGTGSTANIPITFSNKLISKINEIGYYKYEGSLPYPDCKEGYIWFVAADFLPISSSDYDKLKALINKTFAPTSASRPLQALNGRKILKVAPP